MSDLPTLDRRSYSILPRNGRKLLNFVLLVGAYCVGQGSLFASQSWLVATNQLSSLAMFGTSFSFALLAITFVEAGSITVLARKVASENIEGGSDELWLDFISICIVRMSLACIATVLALAAVMLVAEPFYKAYALFSTPAIVLWSSNAAGLLDGRGRSGFSGAVGVFPYLTSALALPLSAGLDPLTGGAVQGAALTTGYSLTVFAQYLVLRRVGLQPRLVRVSKRSLKVAAIVAAQMLATSLPGQLFFRAQLILCGAVLGEVSTALFIYARQITAAAGQLATFVRRTEFPSLVSSLVASGSPVRTTLRVQRSGTLLSAGATLVLLVIGIAATLFASAPFSGAGYILAWFAPIVLTGAYSLAITQGAQARGQFANAAIASNAGILFGLLVSVALVRFLEEPGLAIAAVASQIVTSLIGALLLERSRKGA